MALLANILFLLGSIFQVVCAQSRFKWARSVQGFPVAVLQADDDSTWQTYMSTTAYHAPRPHQKVIASRRVSFIPLNEYASFDWNYLPVDVRDALINLWHDENTWDGNPQSQLEGSKWSELDDYERDAASYLGYDQEQWDSYEYNKYNGGNFTVHSTYNATTDPSQELSYAEAFETANSSLSIQLQFGINTSNPFKPSTWQQRGWETLPPRIIEALEVLGFDEELWESKKQAFTEELSWNELTVQQKEEASFLGYTEDNWNEIRVTSEGEMGKGDTENLDESDTSVNNAEAELEENSPTVAAAAAVIPAGQADISTTELGSPAPAATVAPAASPTKSRATPKATDPPNEVTATETKIPSKSDYFGDDVVMTVLDVEVSSKQIFSLVAAVCFLVTGIVNWIREKQVFHVWLVQGSICMVLSALCTGIIDSGVVLFRLLAFHCFLIEGVFMLRLRKKIRPLDGLETLSYALWAGDGLFGSSSIVSIVTSYWQFFDEDAAFDLNVARGDLLSAWLWLLASIIYMLSPFILIWKRSHLCQPGGNKV